jgi:predicted PurR-regulated permease PerM
MKGMDVFEKEKVRQFFFIVVLAVLGLVLFYYLRSFIPSFLGAVTFYVVMRKYMKRMVARHWKPGAAALLLMLISFLIILLPVLSIINMVGSKISYVISHSSEITSSTIAFLRNIEKTIGHRFLDEQSIRNISGILVSELPLILGATVNMIIALVVMYFILYFMLVNSGSMEHGLEELFLLRKDNFDRVKRQMNQMVISNAVGIPMIACLQGLAGLVLYLILGLNEPLLLFALTAFTSMIPLVGSALVYVPLSVIQFVNGHPSKGIIILLYGLAVIGTIDNVFRLWLQRKIGNVHPLITILGVFVGVPLFGFIGLIFGPLLISLFILLLRIYRVEFISPGEKLED